jgi:hypothetical protein
MALSEARLYGSPLRRLRWLGAPDADYHDIIAIRRREECLRAFLAHLRARGGWHVCDLAELRGAALSGLTATLDLAPIAGETCAVLSLPATREAHKRNMNQKLRASISRGIRQLGESNGPVAFSTVTRAEELPAALDDLLRLHLARNLDRRRASADRIERRFEFHREIAARFLPAGMLRLHRMFAGDR